MRRLVLLAAVFFSLATSSTEEGERAGGCPEDETCSAATPDGLQFRGAELGDQILSEGVQALAVGGVQIVRVFEHDQPFRLAYDAESSQPALAVDAIDGSEVHVRGVSPGAAKLRLVEPGSQLLYDRYEIRVASEDEVVVLPHQLSSGGDRPLRQDPRPDVVFHVDSVWWMTLGFFAGDTRLVDEGLVITPPAGFRLVANRWDGLEADGAPAGEYDIAYEHADGTPGTAHVTLVDRADAIVAVQGTETTQEHLPSDGPIAVGGTGTTFCFRAELGGKPVVGAPLDFAATGVIEAGQRADSCVKVTATSAGSGELLVSLGELEVAFPISAR